MVKDLFTCMIRPHVYIYSTADVLQGAKRGTHTMKQTHIFDIPESMVVKKWCQFDTEQGLEQAEAADKFNNGTNAQSKDKNPISASVQGPRLVNEPPLCQWLRNLPEPNCRPQTVEFRQYAPNELFKQPIRGHILHKYAGATR